MQPSLVKEGSCLFSRVDKSHTRDLYFLLPVETAPAPSPQGQETWVQGSALQGNPGTAFSLPGLSSLSCKEGGWLVPCAHRTPWCASSRAQLQPQSSAPLPELQPRQGWLPEGSCPGLCPRCHCPSLLRPPEPCAPNSCAPAVATLRKMCADVWCSSPKTC